MVAEAGEPQRAGEGAEDLGAAMSSRAAGDEGERAVGDEVSRQQDHVGGESVDVVDDALEEERLSEFVEMDVADLRDAEAMKSAGEVGDDQGAGNEIDLVACDLAGVKGHSRCRGARADKKVATGKELWLIGAGTGHSP